MTAYVFIESSGVISLAGFGDEVPEGATVIPGYSGPINDLARMMVLEGVLQPRPLSPAVVSSGTVHTVSGMPAGTVIEVYDLTGGEIMGTMTAAADDAVQEITLPDAGSYRIEITAPPPHLMTAVEVTV